MKERKWKTLRVIVEVKVPPTTPATEKDLARQIVKAIGSYVTVPRDGHPRSHVGTPRVLTHGAHWAPFARLQGWLPPRTVKVPAYPEEI